MVKTLRESKAKLSQLVELASQGEDVLISVRGRIKARLTRAGTPPGAKSNATWVRELKALQRAYETGRKRRSTQKILDELREERS
jgi:prevent-host-death family protein